MTICQTIAAIKATCPDLTVTYKSDVKEFRLSLRELRGKASEPSAYYTNCKVDAYLTAQATQNELSK